MPYLTFIKYVVDTALILVFVLLLIMLIRMLVATKPRIHNVAFDRAEVDSEGAMKRLSDAVRIKTVTLTDDLLGDGSGFLDFHEYLFKTYPLICERAKVTVINRYSLIFELKGEDESLLPACFLAHMDVVPAPLDGWKTEPFGGEIADGFVHGRGASDMKGQLIAVMEALEYFLASGKRLNRGIYLCFGHDEELTGIHGANRIVEHLIAEKVRFEYVLDEGGIVLDGKILGIKGKIALIGTCEKGYVNVELIAKVAGGHASTPSRKTAVGNLARALIKVEQNKMKAYFNPAVKELFRTLAPQMKGIFKFLFVNIDILRPLALKALTIANPVLNSLLRTTFAPTMLTGSNAPNVLPPEAKAIINARINVGETREDVINHVKKAVGKDIDVHSVYYANDPTAISATDTAAYRLLTGTIAEIYDGYIPAPYPFIASSDAKFYYALSDNVYRYTPFCMDEDDRERIHASNERLSKENLTDGIQFFIRLIENSQQ